MRAIAAGRRPVDEDCKDNHVGVEADQAAERDGGWFTCPNGHQQQYVESTDEATGKLLLRLKHTIETEQARVAKLERQLQRSRTECDRLKKQIERLKDRSVKATAGHGVVCHRRARTKRQEA